MRVRAANPSPLTLDGTNSYVVDGRWVVDPGPSLDQHVEALTAAAACGIEGVVLTHSHADHAEAAEHFADPADPTIAEVQAALEAREGDPLEAYRESLVLGDDVVNVEAFPGGDLDIDPLD